MPELKCDICSKTFWRREIINPSKLVSSSEDNNEITACKECEKTTLYELSNGKGDDNE